MQRRDSDTFLDIQVDRENEIPVVSVDGCLDIYTAQNFKPVVERIVDEGVLRLIVDISRMSHLDSSGIGALVSIHVRLKPRKDSFFALAGANDQVSRLLKVTRLDSLFRMYPTVTAALLYAEEYQRPANLPREAPLK